MSFINLSPAMNLPIPAVGQEPGPQWATDINNSLTLIDSHNHAPGSGVQINPSGLDINTDLSFSSNQAIDLKALVLVPQASLAALTAVYVIGRELYYNDGAGNAVQITSNGSIAGTTGSISGLVPPASASYTAGTFIFQSNALTAANLDAASILMRNATASSFALTLSPPNAMGANYALTLPSLPGANSFMVLSSSGAMSGTIATSGGLTGSNIAAATITGSNMVSGTVTTTQIAAGTVQLTNMATSARESVLAIGMVINLPNNGLVQLVAPSVLTNTSGSYNASTGVYTVPQAGYLDAACAFTVPGTGGGPTNCYIALYVNGAEIDRSTVSIPSSGQLAGVQFSMLGVTVAANDLVTMQARYIGNNPDTQAGFISFTLR